jgi:hypothetical protein
MRHNSTYLSNLFISLFTVVFLVENYDSRSNQSLDERQKNIQVADGARCHIL